MDSLVSPARSPMRVFLPREHGLWCWVGTPLLGAVLLAPSAGATLAVLSVLALFGAGNAARSQAWNPAGAALAASAALGIAALPFLAVPGLWLAVLAALAVGGAIGVETAGRAIGRNVKGHTRYELAAIGGFTGAGAAIAVAAGGAFGAAMAVALTILTWQVIGLWWVRGQMARVLPNRAPWSAGPLAVAALAVGTAAAAFALHTPLLAAVPALYAVRARVTRPATHGRDARRIGLSEAAWAAGATALAALVAA